MKLPCKAYAADEILLLLASLQIAAYCRYHDDVIVSISPHQSNINVIKYLYQMWPALTATLAQPDSNFSVILYEAKWHSYSIYHSYHSSEKVLSSFEIKKSLSVNMPIEIENISPRWSAISGNFIRQVFYSQGGIAFMAAILRWEVCMVKPPVDRPGRRWRRDERAIISWH